jgi:hypothetical protein
MIFVQTCDKTAVEPHVFDGLYQTESNTTSDL